MAAFTERDITAIGSMTQLDGEGKEQLRRVFRRVAVVSGEVDRLLTSLEQQSELLRRDLAVANATAAALGVTVEQHTLDILANDGDISSLTSNVSSLASQVTNISNVQDSHMLSHGQDNVTVSTNETATITRNNLDVNAYNLGFAWASAGFTTTITGLVPPGTSEALSVGAFCRIVKTTNNGTLTLAHENASSSANNRINNIAAVSSTVAEGGQGGFFLFYFGANAGVYRWMAIRAVV